MPQQLIGFSAASSLELQSQELHIWRANLDLPETKVQHMMPWLSSEERERCQRLIKPIHRQRGFASYGILREVLARYLSCGPQELVFAYGAHGKPYLISSLNHLKLQFNMTHSQDVLLIAVTLESEVGIDVEQIRPNPSAEGIVERFLADEEIRQFKELPEKERLLGFYRAWTRKEAFIKAIGLGLSYPLKDFVIDFDPGSMHCLRSIKGDQGQARCWTLYSFCSEETSIASVATEKTLDRIRYWQWS